MPRLQSTASLRRDLVKKVFLYEIVTKKKSILDEKRRQIKYNEINFFSSWKE